MPYLLLSAGGRWQAHPDCAMWMAQGSWHTVCPNHLVPWRCRWRPDSPHPASLPAPQPFSAEVERRKRPFFRRGRTLRTVPVCAGIRRSRMRRAPVSFPAPQPLSAEVECRKRPFSAGAGHCEWPPFAAGSAEVECGARRPRPAPARRARTRSWHPSGRAADRRQGRRDTRIESGRADVRSGAGCGEGPDSAEVERRARPSFAPDFNEVGCDPAAARPHLSRVPAPAAGPRGSGSCGASAAQAASAARGSGHGPSWRAFLIGGVYREQTAQGQPPSRPFSLPRLSPRKRGLPPPSGATEEAYRVLPAAAGRKSPPSAAPKNLSQSARSIIRVSPPNPATP